MNDKRKADQISQVQDKPTEVWIKLLFGITSFAVLLLGYMGDRFIGNQDKLIDGQNRTTDEVGKINGNLQAYKSRITRNERDISSNSDRIFILEGVK